MAYNPDATFYNSKNPMSAAYERLYAKLVPQCGKCDTVEGELLRASSRIYHDYYNNGFGNNWSGALNYLDQHFGLKAGERRLLRAYARGKIVKRSTYNTNTAIPAALEGIAERVVQHVALAEVTGLTPNSDDMFDLQEKSTW